MNSEDIKILENLFYDDESFEPNGYVEIFLHKNEQEAIKHLIARNKELEEERDNLIIQKNADYYKISKLKDDLDEVEGDRDYNYIPKSILQELLDIDEIGVVHCRLKRLLEGGDK